ncbi:MAG: hypothetical protein H0X24_21440 [Ktedonobacterales bacterium]|nr:hypothetical protein [Ktedonobacterales bacterium]
MTPTLPRNFNDHLIEEYKCIVEQTGNLSDRRQTTNDIYVALNTLFLTGLAVLLTTSHLMSWYPAIIIGIVTLISWFINFTWLSLLDRYRTLIKVRIDYLKQLETLFPIKGANIKQGIYLEEEAIYQQRGARFGFTALERRLAGLFIALYPLLTIGIVIATYFTQKGIILPLSFN